MTNRVYEVVASTLLLLIVAGLYGCDDSYDRRRVDGMSGATELDYLRLDLPDGKWRVDFEADTPILRLNETCEGKAELTTVSGFASLKLVMRSQNILKLHVGTAYDAGLPGAEHIYPTTEEVVYPDGFKETVHVFEFLLPALGEEFDLALIGSKGKWYGHKVRVSNPTRLDAAPTSAPVDLSSLPSGDYSLPVELIGGSGRSGVRSPARARFVDGQFLVTLVWDSRYYDYMVVNGARISPISTDDGSQFEFPITELNAPLAVVANSVAMSRPHEIEYELRFGEPTRVDVEPAASDADVANPIAEER